MGDMIANLPALLYLCNTYTHVVPHIWVPDFIVPVYKDVLPSKAIVRGYSEQKKYKQGLSTLTTGITNHKGVSSQRMHPVDYAFVVLLGELPGMEHKNYLKINPVDISKFNLPEKYVCISVGATVAVKVLPPNIINDVARHALSKGYTPVFLGSDQEDVIKGIENLKVFLGDNIDYSAGINLCNKTNLMEAASIIAGSACLIGMEGGLTHIAGMTNTPIVSSYTFADPKLLMPIRENTLGFKVLPVEPTSDCRYCLSVGSFTKHKTNPKQWADFSTCYFDTYDCVSSLTSQMFIDKVNECLR